jgi:ParB family chromosome partitioning protein
LFNKIIQDQLNVRQAEQLAAQFKNPQDKEKAVKQIIIPNHVEKAQKNLSDILNVNVEIKTSANGKKEKLFSILKMKKSWKIFSHIR